MTKTFVSDFTAAHDYSGDTNGKTNTAVSDDDDDDDEDTSDEEGV
jgi:hypothetical protein